jgi:hypothetical protein
MRASSDLGLMVPEIHLFHSRKRLKRFLRSKRCSAKLYDSDGQMLYLDGTVAVLMEHVGRPETEDSLLVHEAYHAAVAHLEWIGEDEAGEETVAYLVQTISNALMKAHHKWRKRLQ